MRLSINNCLRIIATAFALYLLMYYWTSFSGAVLLLIGSASSLIIGAVIAYIVNIPMSFYENALCKFTSAERNTLTRAVCMILALASVVGIVFILIRLVAPELYASIVLLTNEIPPYLKEFADYLKSMNFDVNAILGSNSAIFTGGETDWQSIVTNALNIFFTGLGGVMNSLIAFLSTTLSIVISLLLSLIFAIYLLMGKGTLSSQINRLFAVYLSEKTRKKLYYVLSVLDNSFHKFIVGQCTEAVILGGLCMGGMMLFKFPYATMVGALVGFSALIPIAGAYIGAGVGAFMIFTVSPMQALFFLIFIVVLQQLEGNIVYPRVVGASIGLPGIWVLAAITIGGGIGGIVGMLLGVPLASSAYQLLSADVKMREIQKINKTPNKA